MQASDPLFHHHFFGGWTRTKEGGDAHERVPLFAQGPDADRVQLELIRIEKQTG